MASTCCPTYASTRLLLTGAVLYRRVSRPCKSSTSDHGAAALTRHGANLVHSVPQLPHQPPVSPSPKGDTSMATIVRRIGKNGQTSYRAQVRCKGVPPLSATFTKRSDAHKWVQTTEAAIIEGRHF